MDIREMSNAARVMWIGIIFSTLSVIFFLISIWGGDVRFSYTGAVLILPSLCMAGFGGMVEYS